ncbi:cysteine-rich receptor-like protein kinase 10 isoform X7 [Cinnamomum micranthum f. kanehirae]|uniref:Cysteine-rich receptor-like protein kinase 10 isoform X7 n=1 Tax=Cinnamomum micranthum f. kanehirae TaxID=337451 RepID=A0A3S3MXU5_9MAGN|nr:cysteine-rich receptor-like protein kinase 10 isoform X7 [Cinnamomum micranthum f. kanehirae]
MKHNLLSQKPKYLLFFICLIPLSRNPTRGETPQVYCTNGTNYTNGSKFETNLNLLLPPLTTNGPLNNNTFYNTSYGKEPDRVYGFAQCMSGAPIGDCRVCLNNSWVQILQNCPNRKQAAIRYYNCLLRYSDGPFFSQVETTQRKGIYNTQNIPDPVRFNALVKTLMENVSTTAAMNPSRIGTGVTDYTQSASLYGLAQCTRDLSNISCYRCLEEAIGGITWCCDGKQGGNVYFVSCNIRYDIYPFYPASVNPIRVSIPSPPPHDAETPLWNSSPNNSDGVSKQGKKGKTSQSIAIGLTVTFVGLVLLGCFIFLLHRRRKLQEDQIKRAQLTWKIRHNIVNGIARGLLYLHEDSRLKVIHRDLKASNVLLDYEMNPKISDFGLARTFRENQGVANTKKVIGTYGYMAPEYAMHGRFSVKSDVFSFGVLLLEILSGKKNSRSYLAENAQSLLAHAWQLWCDGNMMELIDPILIDSCPVDEVLRFVHIGLLCIQQDATDRPTMSSVVLMLGSKSVTLPHPTEPPLYLGKREVILEQSSSNPKTFSNNKVTISEVGPG